MVWIIMLIAIDIKKYLINRWLMRDKFNGMLLGQHPIFIQYIVYAAISIRLVLPPEKLLYASCCLV